MPGFCSFQFHAHRLFKDPTIRLHCVVYSTRVVYLEHLLDECMSSKTQDSVILARYIVKIYASWKTISRRLASGITKSPSLATWQVKNQRLQWLPVRHDCFGLCRRTYSLNTAAILASLMEAFLVSQRLSFRSFMSK